MKSILSFNLVDNRSSHDPNQKHSFENLMLAIEISFFIDFYLYWFTHLVKRWNGREKKMNTRNELQKKKNVCHINPKYDLLALSLYYVYISLRINLLTNNADVIFKFQHITLNKDEKYLFSRLDCLSLFSIFSW